MSSNKVVEDAKRLVNLKIANQKQYEKNFEKLGEINPTLPLSQEEKEVKLFDDHREEDAIFGDQFSFLLMPLINDKQFVNYLLGYFSIGQVKDIVTNWNSYLPILQALEGKRLSKVEFVEVLENMMAENINKKHLHDEIKIHRQNQGLIPKDSSSSSERIQSVQNAPHFDQATMNAVLSAYENEEFDKLEHTDVTIPHLAYLISGQQNSKQADVIVSNYFYSLPTHLDQNTVTPEMISAVEKIYEYLIILREFKRDKLMLAITDDIYIQADDVYGFFQIFKKSIKTVKTQITFNMIAQNGLPLEVFNTMKDSDHTGSNFQNLKFAKRKGAMTREQIMKILDDYFTNFDLLCMLVIVYNNLQVDVAEAKEETETKDEKHGHGISLKPHHKGINNFYVDSQKLGNGILEVRYKKNKHLTNIKPQHISNEMKKIVNDMISKNSFETSDYHKLGNTEQHLARSLNHLFGCGVNVHTDSSLDDEFQLILGELGAGNNNEQLRQKARKYILYAMKTGRFPRASAYDLLMEYGL
jgi:hypothetical protein